MYEDTVTTVNGYDLSAYVVSRYIDLRKQIENETSFLPFTEEEQLGYFNRVTGKTQQSENDVQIILEDVGKMYAFIFGTFFSDKGVVCVTVGVLPSHQNKGIGKSLLQSLIRYYQNKDVCALHLYVNVGNEKAIKLYKQFGFTISCTGYLPDEKNRQIWGQLHLMKLCTQ
jgi:ribosomal protein S18 acetylase RimI-like enzyme